LCCSSIILFSGDKSLIMFKLSNFQRESRSKKKEWRLFRAKDFQSLMYPCFTACRILGIFPYKINSSTFEVSKPYYILSAIITCVCSIYTLITLFNPALFGKIDMIHLPGTLANRCNFIFNNFVIIVTFILTGPRLRLLQTMLKISSSLSSESYKKLSRLIHIKDIIGLLLFGPVIIYRSEVYGAFHHYINLVVFQMNMLYMDCVCVLKACFKRINDNLVNMRRVITNNEPCLRLNYHDQGNQFLIMELKALKRQHLVISNAVRMLNMIFSLQLLATVAMTFSDITFNTYYHILLFKYVLPESFQIKGLQYVLFLLYTTFIFIKLALIVWACETGKRQILQISTSIYDVFNHITDEQIKHEVVDNKILKFYISSKLF